jgi:DNA polymerase-1
MVDVHRALREQGLKTRTVLTVHDELVFEVPLDERETVEPLVCRVMEGVYELAVPLVVDVGFGSTWADAK